MKYVKAIFENEDVRNLAVANEEMVQLATESLLAHNIAVQNSILENLEFYVIEGDLVATYENIRNTVINENIAFISESAAILGSDLSEEEKVNIFNETFSPTAFLRASKDVVLKKGKEAAAKAGENGAGVVGKTAAGLKTGAEVAKNIAYVAGKRVVSKYGAGAAAGALAGSAGTAAIMSNKKDK